MRQFDLIIIGSGPGGYNAAHYAAKEGLQVAIVESRTAGGTCPVSYTHLTLPTILLV